MVDSSLPSNHREIIDLAAQRWDVDPQLLYSIMKTESGGQPGQVSPAGAQGWFQLMPPTAKALGVSDPHDFRQSAFGAARLMSENLTRYKGDVIRSVMAYHGGTNEANWGPKTQEYPRTVAIHYASANPTTSNPVDEGAGHRERSSGGGSDPSQVFSPRVVEATPPAMVLMAGLTPEIEAFIMGDQAPPASAPPPPASSLPPEIDRFVMGGDRVTRPIDPDTPTTILGRAAAGVTRGVRDVVDGPAAWLAQGAEGIGLTGALNNSQLGKALGISVPTGTEVVEGNARDREAFAQNLGDSGAAIIGRVGGNVAASLGPLKFGTAALAAGGRALGGAIPGTASAINKLTGVLPTTSRAGSVAVNAAQGATSGAASAALTSDPSKPFLPQVAEGAALGGAIQGSVAPVVNKLLSKVNPRVTELAETAINNHGIDIRPTQMTDPRGLIRRMDSLLDDVPMSGHLAKNREQASAWYRAVNRQMGIDADHINVETIKQAQSQAGRNIENASSGVVLNPADRAFNQGLADIEARAIRNLGAARAQPVVENIKVLKEVLNNRVPGSYRTLTTKSSDLHALASLRDADVGKFGKQLRDQLDDLLERSVPADQVEALKTARRHYYVASQLRPLAKKSSVAGDIDPASLLAKVGETNLPGLRELADIGKQFLGHFRGSPTEGRMWARRILNIAPMALEGGLIYHSPEMAISGAAGLAGAAATARAASAASSSKAIREMMLDAGRANRWGYAPSGINPFLHRYGIPAATSAGQQNWSPNLPEGEISDTFVTGRRP